MKQVLILVIIFLNTTLLFGQASVGTLPGNLEVDMSGAATYSIPIYIPPGTNGMQPNVSLVYSSMAGSGVMGVGWSISGLSAISRVPQNKYFDGKIQGLKYNNTDRFVLDGQRLMPLKGYNFNGSDGEAYRTENDNFARIYSFGINLNYPDKFELHNKDGSIIEYAERVREQGVPISWYISKITDPNGNCIRFEYEKDYDNQILFPSPQYGLQGYYRRYILLTKIKYTYNENTGLYRYNTIEFFYEDNTNHKRFYGNNTRLFIGNEHRLSRIESKANNNIVRQYDFVYDNISSTEQYFLQSITESNSDGDYYNSTVFTWDKTLKYSNKGIKYDDNSEYINYFKNDYNNSSFGRKITNNNDNDKLRRLVGDLNGDGLSDIVAFKTDDFLRIGINDGNRAFNENTFSKLSDALIKSSSAILLDEDGDGKDELITIYNSKDGSYIYFYKFNDISNSFVCYKTYETYGKQPSFKFSNYDNNILDNPDYYSKYYVYVQFADVDGDGKPDLIYVSEGVNNFHIVLNKAHNNTVNIDRNSINIPFNNPTTIMRKNRRFIMADVNGDGLSDFCLFVDNNVYVYFSKGDGNFEIPDGPALTGQFTKNNGWDENIEIQMLDINGDGLADIIGIKDSVIHIALSLGDRFILNNNNGTIGRSNSKDDISKYPLQIRDVNNDGLPDIVFFAHNGLEILTNSIIYDNIFPQFTSIGTLLNWFSLNPYGWNDKHCRILGDFDGDGVIDIFGFGYSALQILEGKSYYPARITAITDGLGNKTEINYQYRRNDFSNNNLSKNYPDLLPLGPSILVDSAIINAIGIGKIFHTDYSFENPVFERTGKGFLGFIDIKQTDNINNAKTIIKSKAVSGNRGGDAKLFYNTNKINVTDSFTMNPIMVPISIEKWMNNTAIFETKYTLYDYYGLKALNSKNIGDKSYAVFPKTIEEYDYLENKLKTTYNTYHSGNTLPNNNNKTDPSDNLNLINQIITYYDGLDKYSTYKFKETKNISYNNIGIRNFKLISDATEKIYILHTNDNHKIWNEYNYDNNGNLTEIITNAAFHNSNVLTKATMFDYDNFGNLISKSENGRDPYIYEYNNKGQLLINETDPVGNKTIYEYDEYYNPIKKKSINVKNPNSSDTLITTYNYDAWGKLTSTKYPDESELFYSLKWNNGTAVFGKYYEEISKNSGQQVTTILLNRKYYNSIGNEILNVTYSGFTGANDIKTETEYNNKGLVIRKSLPYKNSPILNINYEYDNYNRLIEKTGPQEEHIQYEYNGRTTIKRDVLNNNTEYISIKDVLGRTINMTDPGGTIQYTYNTISLPTMITSNGMTTTLQYDAFGNRTKIIEPNYGTTSFTYNPSNPDELINQTDAENTYNYSYDNFGRLIREDIGGSSNIATNTIGSINYFYNPETELLDYVESSLNDGVEHKVEFEYDSLNRIIGKNTTFNITNTNIPYTPPYMFVAIQPYIPIAPYINEFYTSFIYYSQSSLIDTITYPSGLKIKYKYNQYGELNSLEGIIPTDISTMCSVINGYVLRGNQLNNPLNPPIIPKIDYYVNAKNHFSQTTKYNSGINNNIQTEYDFTITGQIENIKTININTNNYIQNLNYQYNAKNQLTGKYCYITNQSEEYTYDNLNRLTNIQTNTPNKPIKNLNMEYDNKGNIIEKSDFGSYIYDAGTPPNNAVSKIEINQQAFMPAAEVKPEYAFGNKIRTLSSVENSTSNSRSNTIIHYGYDKQRIITEDRRVLIENRLFIRKFIDKYYEEEWLYDENHNWVVVDCCSPTKLDTPIIIDEKTLEIAGYRFEGYRVANNSTLQNKPGFIRVGEFYVPFPIPDEVMEHTNISRELKCVRKLHYIYAENDKLIGIYVFNEHITNAYGYYTGLVTDTMYYVHQDRLGSYDVLTNDTGNIPTSAINPVERLAYDVWGNRVEWNNWTKREEHNYDFFKHIFRRGFTQHEHLETFGIINMNGRMYDPNTATFFSPDPYVVDPTSTQAFNRYSYCLNNPLMYTDPTGEFVFLVLGAIGDFLNNLSNWIQSGFDMKYQCEWNAMKTGWEVDKGWFRGDLKQIISRFTIELPQSLLGYVVTGMAAANGHIKEVTNLDGATVAESYREDWGAITFGSFIYGQKDIKAEVGNSLFMHEYGHYLQSQDMGLSYLFEIGMPSLYSAIFSKKIPDDPYNRKTHTFFWTETDANTRSSWYFYSRYGGNWDYNYYPINEKYETYWYNDNNSKPKWGIRR